MPIFLAFVISIGAGVFGFYKYLAPHIPRAITETAQITPTETEKVLPQTTAAEIDYDKLSSEVYSLTSGEIEVTNTPTPTKTKKIPTKIPTITKKPTETPTPTTAILVTPIPTNSPTPTQTAPTPTAASVKNYSSQEINNFIESYGAQYAVDPNVLRHIAVCESGFNTYAKSYNGLYTGLYQFSVGTWENYRNRIGENEDEFLRMDAEEAVHTAAYVLSIGESYIWPNCLP